jgi:hypothetical protein
MPQVSGVEEDDRPGRLEDLDLVWVRGHPRPERQRIGRVPVVPVRSGIRRSGPLPAVNAEDTPQRRQRLPRPGGPPLLEVWVQALVTAAGQRRAKAQPGHPAPLQN